MEDRFSQEAILQPVEGVLAGVVPVPQGVFLGQVQEGASNVGVVTNKLSVEVGGPKERMDVLYLSRGGPISDSVKFGGVYFNVSQG